MIVDNLTKLNQKKKMWMTPRHPLYTKTAEYKVLYGALCFHQAEIDRLHTPMENFELRRLLEAGFFLDTDQMASVLSYSKEPSTVIDRMRSEFASDREKDLLILDLIQVSFSGDDLPEKAWESVRMFAKMFGVPTDNLTLLLAFVRAAQKEEAKTCREILHRMHLLGMELSVVDMKYYIVQLWDMTECTQELIDGTDITRIVDRCKITQDLVLEAGKTLIFDHAEVRITGNILLLGGELIISHSKVIRKGDSHRACINMKSVYSQVQITDSVLDCRNLGMLLRAEAGNLTVKESTIARTTRGAAIRFWGNFLHVENTEFVECYSPEDGGALMIRTPEASVFGCTFRHCEAKRGGAIFAVEKNKIAHCTFEQCDVAEYGAGVFYHGFVGDNVFDLHYSDCHPKGAQTVQYLAQMATFTVDKALQITVSTIVDCPVIVESEGSLTIENANIYLNYPIRCRGDLKLDHVRVISNHLENADMLILEHSKTFRMVCCVLDGMGKTGGICAAKSRIFVSDSLFQNMSGGRAIFDAYAPKITACTFNFCADGGIYAQNGQIRDCLFVNCRAKRGAGVLMYGTAGIVAGCNFKRCVADIRGGGIERALGQQVQNCRYADCRPEGEA